MIRVSLKVNSKQVAVDIEPRFPRRAAARQATDDRHASSAATPVTVALVSCTLTANR